MSRFGLISSGKLNLLRAATLVSAITWLPLLVLTLIEGTAIGSLVAIPFLADYMPYGRYLVAPLLLLLMDQVVERRTALALGHFRETGLIIAADRERFERMVATAERLWRNRFVRWGFVLVVFGLAAPTFARIQRLGISDWMMFARPSGDAAPNLAGLWNVFVSAPLVRLLFLRAFWKLAVWAWLLSRLSRLELQINPMHPDRRCGLHFLGETQLAFTPLIVALGVQLGCATAVAVQYLGFPLPGFRWGVAGFVVLALALTVGPLVVFMRGSWMAKEWGQDAYSSWSIDAVNEMTSRLKRLRQEGRAPRLDGPEISTVTDAGALFERVLQTRPLPVDTRQVVTVLLAATASTLLPLVALLPLRKIVAQLASMLL